MKPPMSQKGITLETPITSKGGPAVFLFFLFFRFRYSEDDVVTYIAQILQGLDYLHSRRILHLDIKPENVIVTHMNVIKIIDFGSAQSYNPLFLKQFSPPIGTLEYMCKGPILPVLLIANFRTQMILDSAT